MSREILSTGRPTMLRLVGFVCLAMGAAAAGAGSADVWASIGFPSDLERVADVEVRGTDVWEGKVVLFAAIVALVGLLAMRLARAGSTRRALAVLLVAAGVAVVALAGSVVLGAEERFAGTEGVDALTARLAAELELPEDLVRDQLRREFERGLRVDVERGVWIAGAGGLLLAAGGVLGWAWSRRRAVEAAGPSRG